jgi:hypothetical protein
VVVSLLGLLALGGLFVETSAEAEAEDGPGAAPVEIHPVFADAYARAAAAAPSHVSACRIRPAVLAGVGRVEFAPGNSNGGDGVDVDPAGLVRPPVYGPPTDHGRAEGPMQFLPSTWATSGLDALGTPGGDGLADPHNIYDAALSAAVYLCRAVPGSSLHSDDDLLTAFFAYNHSWEYAETVLGWVHHFDRRVAESLSPVDGADAADLLSDPRLVLSAVARGDLEAGMVDARLVAALRGILARHSVAISVFKTGHATHVAGTGRVSNHYACDGCPGRAMDIYWVDGEDVSTSSPAAETLVRELIASREALGVDEVGQPFPHLVVSSGEFRAFSDRAHQSHVHVGIDANAREFHPMKDSAGRQ